MTFPLAISSPSIKDGPRRIGCRRNCSHMQSLAGLLGSVPILRHRVTPPDKVEEVSAPRPNGTATPQDEDEVLMIGSRPAQRPEQRPEQRPAHRPHKPRRIGLSHPSMTPNYAIPSDRTLIEHPTSPEERRPQSMFKKPPAPGFRPQNTLRDDQHRSLSGFGCSGTGGGRGGAALDVGTVRGGNVRDQQSRPAERGDGFDLEQREPKRRRFHGNDAVTMDTDDFARYPSNNVVYARQDPRRLNSQGSITSMRSSSGGHVDDPFPTVASSINNLLANHTKKSKRPRHPEGRSTAIPGRSAGQTTPNCKRKAQIMGPKQQVDLTGDADLNSRPSVRAQKTEAEVSEVPPIILDKGYDEIGERVRRRQPDPQGSSAWGEPMKKLVRQNSSQGARAARQDPLQSSRGSGPRSSAMPLHEQDPRSVRNTSTRRSPEPTLGPQGGTRRSSSAEERPKQREPSHHKGLEDDGGSSEEHRKKQKARHRMQAERDDDSSDELAGETNVSSKHSAATCRPTHRAHGVGTLPPSEIKPTKFTESVTRAPPATSTIRTARNSKAVAKTQGSHTTPIPILQIFSRACVLSQTHLTLLWDEEAGGFLICADDEQQKISGKDKLAVLGASETQVWHACKDFPTVYISGAVNDFSNGHILITFDDEHGKTEVHDRLMDTIKTVTQTRQRMIGYYRTQAPSIQQDHLQTLDKASTSRLALSPMPRRSELPAKSETQREETIKYENDKPDNRCTAHQRPLRRGDEMQVDAPTTSPFFADVAQNTGLRRPTRQTRPVKQRTPTPPPPERWTRVHHPKPWAQPVTYPPQGARRATVDFQDLERLDDGEFLNDNLIGFALRRIEEEMAPEHKEKVHFFNSYFYTALSTSKSGRRMFQYDAVKKWTKNKDLLEIPYIVVPINHDLHWFVAIICNLPNVGRKAIGLEEDDHFTARSGVEGALGESGRGSSVLREALVNDSRDRVATENFDKLSIGVGASSPAMSNMFSFDEDGAVAGVAKGGETTSKTTSPSKARRNSKKRPVPLPRKYDTEQPTIITLDSFGTAHTGEIAFLKDYVIAEAEDKRQMEITRQDLQGVTAKGIPEQDNFCDCGVYLVGYLDAFARDPRGFVDKVLSKQLDPKRDFPGFHPSDKRAELREALLGLQEEQETGGKTAKNDNRVAIKGQVDGAASSPAQPPPALPPRVPITSSTTQASGDGAVPSATAAQVEAEPARAKTSSEPAAIGILLPPSSTLAPTNERNDPDDVVSKTDSKTQPAAESQEMESEPARPLSVSAPADGVYGLSLPFASQENSGVEAKQNGVAEDSESSNDLPTSASGDDGVGGVAAGPLQTRPPSANADKDSKTRARSSPMSSPARRGHRERGGQSASPGQGQSGFGLKAVAHEGREEFGVTEPHAG